MARRWTQEELHAVRGQPLEDVARQLGHRRDAGDRAGKRVLKGPRRLPDHHLNPATRYHLPRTERSTYSPPFLLNQIPQANRLPIHRKRNSKPPEMVRSMEPLRDPLHMRPLHGR